MRSPKITRRNFCATGASTAAMALLFSFSTDAASKPWVAKGGPIKIGLLWSLTGVLSVAEKANRDVALFWIDEVNRNGGIAGMEVIPVEVDTESDMETYRRGMMRLIRDERVLSVFGCYTSASRRAVMPLVTLNNHLLYYPTFYEGRECWQNVICTGAVPNQQSIDLIPYMVEHFGPRVYFVGSNYQFPKVSNRSAKVWLKRVRGELVGERYVPLGLGIFGEAFKDIKREKPDWIFSTVVGDSDVYFRQQYIKAGFKPDSMPTATLVTTEAEVRAMGYEFGEGHYCSQTYFQSLKNSANRTFVEEFLASPYGESGVTQTNMEAAYVSFKLFHKAVDRIVETQGVEALTPERIRSASAGLVLTSEESPQGPIKIDPNNFNVWTTPRIGRFDSVGQVEVLFDRGNWVEPKPFLAYPDRGTCKADGLHLPNGKIVRAAS